MLTLIVLAQATIVNFVAADATDAIQKAINSGASEIIIPYVGQDWIVRPLTLASNQTIRLEPGVAVVAKKGHFQGNNDCLIRGNRVTNVTIQGYGAVLRMRKADYQDRKKYAPAEWRHGISLRGCRDIKILGVRVESTGGDGIYVGPQLKTWIPCKNILIQDVVCDDNLRQGLSITSVRNLLVDNCVFSNTSGGRPGAGLDIEPNVVWDHVCNIVVRNSQSVGNEGAGWFVNLSRLGKASSYVDIRFENCFVQRCGDAGSLRLKSIDSDSPRGIVEFIDCVFEDPRYAYWKQSPLLIRFENCKWKIGRDVLHIQRWQGQSLMEPKE
jgi:polygalacturonase